jgi:hypothetical protein
MSVCGPRSAVTASSYPGSAHNVYTNNDGERINSLDRSSTAAVDWIIGGHGANGCSASACVRDVPTTIPTTHSGNRVISRHHAWHAERAKNGMTCMDAWEKYCAALNGRRKSVTSLPAAPRAWASGRLDGCNVINATYLGLSDVGRAPATAGVLGRHGETIVFDHTRVARAYYEIAAEKRYRRETIG